VNYIQKKIWLAWSKFRFLRLPVEKRVCLEVTTDGRHLTFLLVSFYEAGYGVQVFGSQFVFRELMLLRKTAPIPFLYGGKERECGISISDKARFNRGGHRGHGGGKRVLLDYDYFSGLAMKGHESEVEELTTESTEDTTEQPGSCELEQPKVGPKGEEAGATESKIAAGMRLASQASASEPDYLTSKLAHAPVSESLIRSADAPTSSLDTGHSPPATALRAPYFMHPSVYHRGLHKRQLAERSKHVPCSATVQALEFGRMPPVTSYSPQRRRRFRIGFFGTHDREFYTQHYHFPGMNRFEILEVFLKKFGDRITPLRGRAMDWDSCEIAVSIDARGGDRKGKSFLSQDHYFKALRECDFVLSPPGWCMPLSHNLIEAMFCGAIPITNGSLFMAEPLSNRGTCLEFEDAEGLVAVIEHALAMDAGEVELMRRAVLEYYDRFLEPKTSAQELVGNEGERVFVNAEENSVRLIFQGMVFPWSVTAEAVGR
jgi:hypothetical protein